MEIRNLKQTTVTTLGNAAEVISRVMVNIAGNDISTNLNGNHITLNAIRDLSMARMNLNLSEKSK